MDTISIIVIVFYAISCGTFTAKVAMTKGYDAVNWFFAGIVFSIIALIAVIGLPIKTHKTVKE